MRQFRTSTDSVFDLDTDLDHADGPTVVAQAGPPAQEAMLPQTGDA
ncbi:MAG: hypothetical protein ACTHKG_17235 [Nocardioides sp.]